MSEKQLIGREARVDIIGDIDNVPAKIDTGADGSAIWASNIHIDDNNNLLSDLNYSTKALRIIRDKSIYAANILSRGLKVLLGMLY